MAKQKQRAAYMRGYRDSMKEQDTFLSDMERTLYTIALSIETSNTMSFDTVLDKINLLRTAIDEYRDENYGGIEKDDLESVFRKRTIIDLQNDDNTFLDDIEEGDLIDDKTLKFLTDNDIQFGEEDD